VDGFEEVIQKVVKTVPSYSSVSIAAPVRYYSLPTKHISIPLVELLNVECEYSQLASCRLGTGTLTLFGLVVPVRETHRRVKIIMFKVLFCYPRAWLFLFRNWAAPAIA